MNRSITRSLFAIDIAWLVLAVGYLYRLFDQRPETYTPLFHRMMLVVSIGVWTLLALTVRLDYFDKGWRSHAVLTAIAAKTAVLTASIVAFSYPVMQSFPGKRLLFFTLLLFAGFIVIRLAIYLFLCWQHARGHSRQVVLMGDERFTREFASKISKHPELLYEVVGTLYPMGGSGHFADVHRNESAMGQSGLLEAFAERNVSDLIVLLDGSYDSEIHSLVASCTKRGMRVSVLPGGYELYTTKPRLMDIDGFPLVSLDGPQPAPGAELVKRIMDIAIS